MSQAKTTVKIRQFSLIRRNECKIYFEEISVFEHVRGRKPVFVMHLNQNARFCISKLQGSNQSNKFKFTLRNEGKQIQLQLENHQDLDYCTKYVGRYGYAFGIQNIISEMSKVGKGNFALVYKFISNFNTTKAMKMFQKRKLQNTKQKLSLLNQIKIMRYLDSPHLASLDCIFQTDKTYYLQMQYFQETLKSYLKKPINKKIQKKIMKNLLNGLIQLQQKGVVHRDIKPDNIMVRKKDKDQDQFVIIDFGLAAKIEQQNFIHKKCGTPGFIAPQICNMGEKTVISSKCDMFSLGVTFFYILTSKKPFIGADHKQILLKNKKNVVQEHLFYYMSQREYDLVKKMMQKDPNKRISASQALSHSYFQEQIDDQDIIQEQNCDLNTKLKQLKIMDTSFMSQGIVLLYSLLKLSYLKNNQIQEFTKCIVDTEFNELQTKQQSIQEEIKYILKNSKQKRAIQG